MSSQRNLPQSKEALLKSYNTRLKEDVKSMLENFEGRGAFRSHTIVLNSDKCFGSTIRQSVKLLILFFHIHRTLCSSYPLPMW